MKKQRILSVLLGLVLSTSLLPVMGAFVVSPTPGQTGKWSCVDGVTSIPTGYAKTAAKQICNVLNTLETAAKSLDSVAQAIVIPFQLVPNSDGTHDTTYPTGNKPPTTTVAWDLTALNALMAPVLTRTTGDGGVSINLMPACTGTQCGSATCQLHAVVTGWALSSACVLTNNGMSAGQSPPAIVADLCYPTCAAFSSSPSYNWAYAAPPGGDSTAPNKSTGITGTAGAGQVTLLIDGSTDPHGIVNRTGVKDYLTYLNGVLIDTYTAPTPGLDLAFTAAAIGVTTGSATQSSAPAGNQWSITNNGGTGGGLENNQNTSVYAITTPVSGTALCGRMGFNSITTAATYGKAPSGFRNSPTSGTSAEVTPVVLKQVITGVTTWYLQVMVRANDAGTMVSAGQIQLSGPPDSVAVCPVNGVASVKYSYDGGTWVTAFTNIAISLNASKYFGCGAAATNDGATGVSITVSVSYCDVVDAAQLSRTIVSNCTTACIWTTKVRDVSLNVSVASGNLSLIPNPAGGGGPSMKFFAGNYVRAHTHNLSCAAPCDATRHSIYSQASMGSDANIIGTEIWIDWKYLESDAGGDFSAGFTWLHNEINFVKTNYPGKKVGLMLNIAPYGPSALNQAGSWFPAYLANAGCLYMEGSAGASGGSDTINWFKNNSTCLGYYNRMIAAYGAEFDSDVGLAFIRIQQETDDGINNAGISGPAEDAAWKNIALASRNAFPTTPIWIPVNWTGVETAAAKEALLLYYKSIQVGAGNGDTQPKDLAYSCASTAWVCIVLGLNASIGGTNHNNCGEFISMGSVELSEMGYNSVVDPFGGLTSQQVITSWNNDTCQQFGIWEPNFGETGTPATMYWNGANGQKWAIDTIGLTHLTKPAGVP